MTKTIATITLDILRGHQYANLTTYRKNGHAIITPIWFILENDRAYIMTSGESGKVKRLRNNPTALLGPSDRSGKPLGPQIELRARILEPTEIAPIRQALDKKYGIVKKLIDLILKLRGELNKRVYIELARPTPTNAP